MTLSFLLSNCSNNFTLWFGSRSWVPTRYNRFFLPTFPTGSAHNFITLLPELMTDDACCAQQFLQPRC